MASKVMDLLYWKDTERTGLVFTGLVVALLSLFQLSIITVFSTLALAIMCFTISVRVYYGLLHAIQWGDGVHPFQSYLDLDVSFSGDEANRYIQRAILLTCSAVDAVKRLFFVSSLCDSLKFLLLMYLVTYLGNLCNGLTLLITGVIAVFSLPVFYKQHQEKVDSVVAAVRAHTENIKDMWRHQPRLHPWRCQTQGQVTKMRSREGERRSYRLSLRCLNQQSVFGLSVSFAGVV
ncbi:reticulon-1-A-like isoform X1 [Denticeps clupeoides]|uniref:reticulon-1-A-like isoform X1 n=1 Tax=Denticeps clupeoides TaxID=299321 RepID=UPI0010A49737|nr:reticulon-1-A-like isoform X1 [Denticeps clupeoides]